MNNTTPKLKISLFGPVKIERAGQAVARLHSRKELWLLAMLVLRNGEDVLRSQLAGLLWPDNFEEQSLAYLRRSLYLLKRSLGPEADRLQSQASRSLHFDLTDIFVDVIAFDAAISRGDSESLAQAIALYRGPLLEECDEEWVLTERILREQAFLQALETQAERAIADGKPRMALPWLRQLIQKDPYRESAHRSLMTALADDGDYGAMILTYRELRELLRQEVNAHPAAETTALYERLRQRAGTLPPAPSLQEANVIGGQTETEPAVVLPAPPPPDPPPAARKIPHTWTPLLGRESLVLEVQAGLQAAPLLTLTGPGGVGKTRVALQIAQEAQEARARSEGLGDVWFVELASVKGSTPIADVVAGVLGITEEVSLSLEETLQRALSERAGLLVLDNCEHLLEACVAFCHALLRSCRHLRILTTSRQAFGIPGELVLSVPPLETPTLPTESVRRRMEGDKDLVGILMDYPAIRLFVQRAQGVSPSFHITPANASAVAQICRHLDGIPLAIELAAARMRMLSAEQILHRLDDRFRLLSTGLRALLPHHQTLQALIDWSYDLLTEPEKILFRRLSVFAGGWSLEAAEAVASFREEGTGKREEGTSREQREGKREKKHPNALTPQSPDAQCPTSDVAAPNSSLFPLPSSLDVLASLVEKSLVQVDTEGAEPRYNFLETLRDYGRQRLEEAGETAHMEQRHAEWCLEFAEETSHFMYGPEEERSLRLLDREQENLWAALDRGIAGHIDPKTLIRLAPRLTDYWTVRGRFMEARRWLEVVLEVSADAGDDDGRSRVLNTAGLVAYHQWDMTAALKYHEECLALRRRMEYHIGVAGTLNNMAMVYHKVGDAERARSLYLEALKANRELNNVPWQAVNLNNLGNLAVDHGWHDEAEGYLDGGLKITRELGNRVAAASIVHNLGHLALQRGQLDTATAYFQEALEDARELGDDRQASSALLGVATAALQADRTNEARERLRETLQLAVSGGDTEMITFVFVAVSDLALRHERFASAARLIAAEERWRARVGIPLTPVHQTTREASLRKIREGLNDTAFAAAWSEGESFEEQEAVRYAFTELLPEP